MWNFNFASLAQVSSFVGFSPVQTPVCKKVDMNVQAAPGMCSQSSAWHRRLKSVKNKANIPRPGLHGASHLSQAGRGNGSSGKSLRQSGYSVQVARRSGGVPPSVAHSSVPWSEPDVKPLVSGATPEIKSRTRSALGSAREALVELGGVGLDYDTGDWKNGQSLRRRLDESAWKLPNGVLIEERAKVDASTLSSLFAEGKPVRLEQRKNSSKGKRRLQNPEDSLVFKFVRSNSDSNLMLEEEHPSSDTVLNKTASKNVTLVQRNESQEEDGFSSLNPGTTTSTVARALGAAVAETANNLREKYIAFTSQVGAAFESLENASANAMQNEASLTWENAVTEAAGNLQRRKSLTSKQGSLRKELFNHDNNVGSKQGFEKVSRSPQDRSAMVQQGTNITKLLENDRKVILEGISWVSEVVVPGMRQAVGDLLRLKQTEVSAVPTVSVPSWPQPWYPGLSGGELLAADIQALQNYVGVTRKWCSLWLAPLQDTYDSEQVARYFTLRPHLLLFRLFEVSAAFGYVALQLMVERATASSLGEAVLEEDDAKATMKSATVLKQTLLRLGPTFIKVAQSLSARPDLIGPATAKVLSELQDRLPPFPTEDAIAILEAELGRPVTEVFSNLSDKPVAAASFGQVYRGRTVYGDEVAVKVQRPGLLFSVARDIYILRLGLGLVRKVAKMNSDISLLADELGRGLYGELDYCLEAANAKKFQEAHAHLKYVVVPRTLPALTTRKVLVMEWIHGERPGDLQAMANGHLYSVEDQNQARLRLVSLVNNGVQASLVQLLETGFMHADPHPGNLLFTSCGNLGFLDFGLVCQVERKHRAAMFASIAHLVNGEWRCLVDDLGDMDILKPTTDRFALQLELQDSFGKGPDAVVKNEMPNFRFGQVAGKLWKVALKFRFRLPPYYTLVLRSLASLEGVALSVNPDFKIFGSAYPYVVSRLLTDNSSSTRQVLHSLLLDGNREFRWDRIGSLVSISKEASLKEGSSVFVNVEGDKPMPEARMKTPSASQPEIASTILKMVLSHEGHAIRRVLLEADTRALARAFTSKTAAPLRRRVAEIAADAFYKSFQETTSIHAVKTAKSSQSLGTEGNGGGSGSQQQEALADVLKNRRLRFLMAALASRLKGAPLLMLRVGWTCTTMVCFAVAVALYKVVAATADRLLKTEPVSVKQRLEGTGERLGSWTAGASNTASVYACAK